MKFEFVKEKELELINNRFAEEDSIDYDNWDLMSNEEILITDAAMFVDEAYCDNEFEYRVCVRGEVILEFLTLATVLRFCSEPTSGSLKSI